MRLFSTLTLLSMAIGLASSACSSSDDTDGVGGAGANTDGGAGGAKADGGGTAGGSAGGAALDIHCTADDQDSCICIQDKNNVWPDEGVKTCSPSSVGLGHGYCCAEAAYPGSNTCVCQAWGCFEGAMCTCGIINAQEAATSCTKPWQICCANSVGGAISMCSCFNDTKCPDGDIQVASCGLETARCYTGSLKVDSCTFKN